MNKLLIIFLILFCYGCKQADLVPAENISQRDGVVKVLSAPKPVYPKRALMNGITGWVTVSVDVTEEGKGINIKALNSSDMQTFGKSAVKSVNEWVFSVPKGKDSASFPVRKVYKVKFGIL